MRAELTRDLLWERRHALLWWTIGISAAIAINIAFYPSVRESKGLADYSKDLPEAMRALFAGGELDLGSPRGYLNSQVFALMGPMLLTIFSIGLGAGAIAGDEERGTLELTLAQPVRRSSVVLQRAAAMIAAVALLGLVLFASVALGCRLVDLEISLSSLLAASVSATLLSAVFGTFALGAGSVLPGKGRAIAIAAGLAVAAWMLDGLAQAVGALEPWRPLSPYYHAFGHNPLSQGAPWGGWAVLVGLAAASIAAAVAGFTRRDVEG